MMFLFSSLQNICSLECIIAYIVCGWVVTIPSSLTIAFFATLSYMHHFLNEIHCLDQNWHLFLFVSAHFKYPINNKLGKNLIVELFWVIMIYGRDSIRCLVSTLLRNFRYIFHFNFYITIVLIFSPGSLKRSASCQHLATWSAKCFHQSSPSSLLSSSSL